MLVPKKLKQLEKKKKKKKYISGISVHFNNITIRECLDHSFGEIIMDGVRVLHNKMSGVLMLMKRKEK